MQILQCSKQDSEEQSTPNLSTCQFGASFGYNDTVHFLMGKSIYSDDVTIDRNHYFKKVKEIWTASTKYSNKRGSLKNIFLTLEKEASSNDRPASIVLRAKKRDE